MKADLLPCPFCGSTDLKIEPTKVRLNHKLPETVLVPTVEHWCGGINPTLFIRVTGMDHDAVVGKWNTTVLQERWNQLTEYTKD